MRCAVTNIRTNDTKYVIQLQLTANHLLLRNSKPESYRNRRYIFTRRRTMDDDATVPRSWSHICLTAHVTLIRANTDAKVYRALM